MSTLALALLEEAFARGLLNDCLVFTGLFVILLDPAKCLELGDGMRASSSCRWQNWSQVSHVVLQSSRIFVKLNLTNLFFICAAI